MHNHIKILLLLLLLFEYMIKQCKSLYIKWFLSGTIVLKHTKNNSFNQILKKRERHCLYIQAVILDK